MILSLDLRRTVSCLVEFDPVTLAACPHVTPSPEACVSRLDMNDRMEQLQSDLGRIMNVLQVEGRWPSPPIV